MVLGALIRTLFLNFGCFSNINLPLKAENQLSDCTGRVQVALERMRHKLLRNQLGALCLLNLLVPQLFVSFKAL